MKNCVRKLRRDRDMSQDELAAAVGVGRHTIIDIEQGGRDPSTSISLRIAKFFEKDPRDIFFIDDDNYIQHWSERDVEAHDDDSDIDTDEPAPRATTSG